MLSASLEQQQLLLEVSKLDAEITKLKLNLKQIESNSEADQLRKALLESSDELLQQNADSERIQTEIKKLAADLQLVEDRMEFDKKRAKQVNSDRELKAVEQELTQIPRLADALMLGGLALGGDARDVLKGEAAVLIALQPRRERTGRGGRRDRGAINPVGNPLFDALRELRRSLAAEAGVPPYVIFHDATLREMAETRPASLAQLGEVGGVGSRKLAAYGEAFLATIRRY